jgi:hypothetical protein
VIDPRAPRTPPPEGHCAANELPSSPTTLSVAALVSRTRLQNGIPPRASAGLAGRLRCNYSTSFFVAGRTFYRHAWGAKRSSPRSSDLSIPRPRFAAIGLMESHPPRANRWSGFDSGGDMPTYLAPQHKNSHISGVVQYCRSGISPQCSTHSESPWRHRSHQVATQPHTRCRSLWRGLSDRQRRRPFPSPNSRFPAFLRYILQLWKEMLPERKSFSPTSNGRRAPARSLVREKKFCSRSIKVSRMTDLAGRRDIIHCKRRKRCGKPLPGPLEDRWEALIEKQRYLHRLLRPLP